MKAARVQKPSKPDALLDSGMVQDIKRSRIQSILWNYDRAITEAEEIWGTDRLPYLVGEELRLKWWRNVEALNKAISENDVDTVEARVTGMIKGISRLIEEAKAAGQKPLEPQTWETPMGDKVLRIVKAWPAHSDQVDKRPNVLTYSIEEVARIINARENELVNKIKEQWPGATDREVWTAAEVAIIVNKQAGGQLGEIKRLWPDSKLVSVGGPSGFDDMVNDLDMTKPSTLPKLFDTKAFKGSR